MHEMIGYMVQENGALLQLRASRGGHFRPIAPILIIVIVLVVSGAPIGGEESDAGVEVPWLLATALSADHAGSVLGVWRWGELGGYPPVERAAAARRRGLELELPVLDRLWDAPLGVLNALRIDPALVLELWAEMDELEADDVEIAWLRTSRGPGELRSRMLAAGLVASPTEPGLFAEPMDPDGDERYRSLMDTIHPDERELTKWLLLRRGHRFRLLEGGWIEVYPPLATEPAARSKLVALEPEEMPSPWRALLDEEASAVIATQTPERDSVEAFDPDVPAELRRRIRRLRSPLTDASTFAGDAAARFEEIDGGLLLEGWVETRGSEPEQVVVLTRAVAAVAASVTAGSSFALARELLDARIWRDGGHGRFEAVVSTASLLEALEVEAARREEIQVLERQLETLTASQRRQDDGP